MILTSLYTYSHYIRVVDDILLRFTFAYIEERSCSVSTEWNECSLAMILSLRKLGENILYSTPFCYIHVESFAQCLCNWLLLFLCYISSKSQVLLFAYLAKSILLVLMCLIWCKNLHTRLCYNSSTRSNNFFC